MSTPVADTQPFDLSQYLSRLTLQPIVHGFLAPPMPKAAERSILTPLSLIPGGYRRLRDFETIPCQHFENKATKYFSKVDGNLFRDLKLALTDEIVQFGDAEFSPYLVNNAINVVSVLNRFLLPSIEMLLNVDEDMHGWTFQTIRRFRSNPRLNQPLDPIILCRPDPADQYKSVKLVMAPLCPWEFAPRDFSDFVSAKQFDDTPVDPKSDPDYKGWSNADRMWAYLYDLCLDLDCPYFAVSSHEQWSFGAFSQYYTRGFITPPFSFDNKPGSIIELLTFWIHASFQKLGTVGIPPVEREKHIPPERMGREKQLHAKRFLNDGLSGAGPDLDNSDMPPAKRQRREPADDKTSVHDSTTSDVKMLQQSMPLERLEKPPRLSRFRKMRAARKRRDRTLATLRNDRSEEVFSPPSIAPSCAGPLPEKLIPRKKNGSILRWIEMVNYVQEHGDPPPEPKPEGVKMPEHDLITGEATGDFKLILGHACSSCGPPSEATSECSLSSEELARWNKQEEPDTSWVILHQWGGDQWCSK